MYDTLFIIFKIVFEESECIQSFIPKRLLILVVKSPEAGKAGPNYILADLIVIKKLYDLRKKSLHIFSFSSNTISF